MTDHDPSDLDFTALAEERAPAPPVREQPTAAEEQEALIGAQALGAEGFHLIATRRTGRSGRRDSTSSPLATRESRPAPSPRR